LAAGDIHYLIFAKDSYALTGKMPPSLAGRLVFSPKNVEKTKRIDVGGFPAPGGRKPRFAS
jgi:hypothetical protein